MKEMSPSPPPLVPAQSQALVVQRPSSVQAQSLVSHYEGYPLTSMRMSTVPLMGRLPLMAPAPAYGGYPTAAVRMPHPVATPIGVSAALPIQRPMVMSPNLQMIHPSDGHSSSNGVAVPLSGSENNIQWSKAVGAPGGIQWSTAVCAASPPGWPVNGYPAVMSNGSPAQPVGLFFFSNS